MGLAIIDANIILRLDFLCSLCSRDRENSFDILHLVVALKFFSQDIDRIGSCLFASCPSNIIGNCIITQETIFHCGQLRIVRAIYFTVILSSHSNFLRPDVNSSNQILYRFVIRIRYLNQNLFYAIRHIGIGTKFIFPSLAAIIAVLQHISLYRTIHSNRMGFCIILAAVIRHRNCFLTICRSDGKYAGLVEYVIIALAGLSIRNNFIGANCLTCISLHGILYLVTI